MALFQAAQGEKIVFQGNVMWWKAKMLAEPAIVTITDKRFVLEKGATPGAGLLALWLMKSYRPRIVTDIPLGEIKKTTIVKMKIAASKKVHIESGGKTITIQRDDVNTITPFLPNVVDESEK